MSVHHVWSHNEWGPLKEVIVGDLYEFDQIDVDLSFRYFFLDNINDQDGRLLTQIINKSLKIQKKLIKERKEDLDHLALFLQSRGIIVHRPVHNVSVHPFKTLDFEAMPGPCDNPRDLTLILGDTIVETPVSWKRRYFENHTLSHIFLKKFKQGAKWISAPKGRLGEDAYDITNVDLSLMPETNWKNYIPKPEKYEILFDAAQCLRFGRDILMNVANDNHRLGLAWLEGIFKDRYRFHPVHLTDHHIDGMLMPLRPGLLLINPKVMASKLHLLPKSLQKWDLVISPLDKNKDYGPIDPFLASENIPVNVLPLNEKEVLIMDAPGIELGPFLEALSKKGMEPHLLRFRHGRIFGGGLHCATLDLVRESEAEFVF